MDQRKRHGATFRASANFRAFISIAGDAAVWSGELDDPQTKASG